ncbi:hypothetical protein X975_26410, partial [Stegodyphus mimosarum]
MFSVSIRDCTGFATGESKEKSLKTNFAQTEILQNDEKNCQVPQRESVQVQTDTKEKKGDIFVEFDVDNLSNFLSRVTPLVCSVLEKNAKSQAFHQYNLLSDKDDSTISCKYLLEKSLPSDFCCNFVSWNSVGTAVAAA